VTQYTTPQAQAGRGDLIRSAVVVVALLVALLVLWHTRLLILLTVLGILLGIAAQPAVDWLAGKRIPRYFGAPLTVGGTAALILSVLLLSGPTLTSQFQALREQVPESINQIDAYFASEHGALFDALFPHDTTASGEYTTASDRLGKALLSQIGLIRGRLFGALSSTFALLAGFIYVFFITIYLAIEPTVYRRGVLLLIPVQARERAALVFDAITATLRTWVNTQFIAMIVIGIVTTIVLFALDVKSALPLGLMAGIFEFVPNIGPILSAIPAVLISFADAPEKAFAVALAYWGIQFLENNLLIPYLMREELNLPPALTLLWQAFMAIVFGLIGLFVAVPVLAAVVVAVQRLHVRGEVPDVRRPRRSGGVQTMEDEPEQFTA